MPRRSAAILLLAGLVAADVVLVTGALRSTHVDTSALAQAAAAHTAGPASSPTPSSSSSKTAATSAGTARAGKVIVAALSNQRAWRASAPSVTCTSGGAAATIGRTQDGGDDWTTVKVPLNTVSGLSYADGRIIATGLDSTCRPAAYALSSTSEPRKSTTTATWALDPADPAKVLASGEPVTKKPCAIGVLDIAANSASDVVALCADGSIQHSINGGGSWNTTDPRPGIVAIATGPNSIFTAMRAKCGIAVSPTSSGKSTNCVPGTRGWKGPVDMTIVGGTVWLVTADAAVTERVAEIG